MLDTRLILIDGLTGTGKSTSAQRLWLHLECCGRAARWFYEHDFAHPIWPSGEQEQILVSGGITADFVAETLPQRWRRLADECAAGTATTILESTLFQSTVGFLLAMNVDEHAIRASVLAADRELQALAPVHVYFSPGDVSQALHRVFDARRADDYEALLVQHVVRTPYGRRAGLNDAAGLVRFLEHWRDLVESLHTQLGMRKLVIDQSDWPVREKQLTDFLGLPPMSETQLRIDEPSRFIGRYQDAASNDQLEVASDACGLYLDDARHTRLISRPDGGFLVAAMDVEVSFSQQDGAGRFRRLDLHGSLPGLSPLWTRVEGQR